MSDAKPSIKWEDKLKQDIERGSEKAVISKLTHGAAVFGTLAVAGGLARYAESASQPCSTLNFIHIGSLAAYFGIQCWVSFAGGLIMFRTLPRHMFGHVQSYMFPTYFNIGVATGSITLTTFLLMHPRGSWGCSEKTQLMALGTALLSSLFSAYYVTPQSILSMWQMYKVEQELGTGMEVGAKYPDKEKNPEFAKLHKRFARWHVASLLVNMASFIGNGMHLWYLASNVRI